MGSFPETYNEMIQRIPPCEQEALPKLRQSFEVAAARTSGLVNLVFSRQTGFLCATIRLYVHNRARCTKRMDIRPGFEAVS